MTVMRGDQIGNQVSAAIADRSPAIFRWNVDEYGMITNHSQGTCPLPREIPCPPGTPSAPARSGDYLIIWCTGLGPVTPPVATGAAAPFAPFASAVQKPTVLFVSGPIAGSFGSVKRVPPEFAGLTPGAVGLFQVNVRVPRNLGVNSRLGVQLEFADGSVSNIVDIAVE